MNDPDHIGAGQLANNIMFFARALRDAGLPVGPGASLDALTAVEAVGFGAKRDLHDILHAIFVKRHEHTILFDQAFQIFWKRKGFMEKLLATLSPRMEGAKNEAPKAEAGATRIADAIFKTPAKNEAARPSLDLDARLTMSAAEILQSRDFAQMSAAEIARALELVKRLRLPMDQIPTRRLLTSHKRARIDPRRSMRRSLKAGGAGIELAFRAPARRHPPIVALCDISGSMADYSRLFLHFLHAIGQTRRVSTFLFGTRLTNVTRALRAGDADDALARCSDLVRDWSGGTRIASSLHRFNKDWSRRVLGQGAIALLFSDGLERDGLVELSAEMQRLQRSSRRLIWLNPLLRYDAFAAKALGIRAMLPYVDEFRPIHNLASMAELCQALSRDAKPSDPKSWLRRSG